MGRGGVGEGVGGRREVIGYKHMEFFGYLNFRQ